MSQEKLSEAELCGEFRGWLEERSFIVHPEVSDWDLVALAPANNIFNIDLTGEQIGIQAKLLCNVDVLYQAIGSSNTGPRRRMILVRRASPEFVAVAAELGLAVATREVQRRVFGKKMDWLRAGDGFTVFGRLKPFEMRRQLVLPPVVTDLVAGGPCPKQLTPWRIKAFKVCAILREKGFVTTTDFKAIGIDYRRWDGQWLRRVVRDVAQENCGNRGRNQLRPAVTFEAIPGVKLPDDGWETVIAALAKKELDEKAAV